MTNLGRLIATATLIGAAALAPRLASADDRFDRGDDERAGFGPQVPAPAFQRDRGCGHAVLLDGSEWATRDEVRWGGGEASRDGWRRQALQQRHAEARALRLELAALDRDRAAFHARFAWHPRKLARYDARYLDRRAELEDRLQRLSWYAWR